MARQPQSTVSQRRSPRLYLITPPVEDSITLTGALADVLDTIDVAAVLLRLPDADEKSLLGRIEALAAMVQDRGVALLLEGRSELAANCRADGAHLTGVVAFASALGCLKPGRIAGAGGLETRHDAMLAGEAGADYVMFGEPHPNGGRPAFGTILERVAWWTELFLPPCVGFAARPDEIAALAAAGADFIAVDHVLSSDRRRAIAAAQAAAERLAIPELVP
jgi:thiamine-phosphate pyrophosphorylase